MQVLISSVLLPKIRQRPSVRFGDRIPLHDNVEHKMAVFNVLSIRSDLQARGYGKHILPLTKHYIRHHWHS